MSNDGKQLKVVRTAEVPWAPGLTRGKYENQRKDLGGLELLRTGLWSLAPGKKSFPLHAHAATEEAMFVIAGRAKVRTPDGAIDIGPGDYVAFPRSGPAHQLENDGTEPLLYLAMSANAVGVDVVQYPATGKVACTAGTPPAGKRWIFKESTQIDYFEGDDDA